MTDTYGWAIINRSGYVTLPVLRSRAETIAHFLGSMDQEISPKPMLGTALDDRQYRHWRRWKHNHGTRCIRVRVSPAFGDTP